MPKALGLLWLLASTAYAQTCKYASLNKPSIIAADGNCPSSSVCALNGATCASLSTYPDGAVRWSIVHAVGEMTNYKAYDMTLLNSTSMDLRMMKLPAVVKTIVIMNTDTVDISTVSSPTPPTWSFRNVSKISWPSVWPVSSVTSLSCETCNLKEIPAGLPSGVSYMFLMNNSISDLSRVPDTISSLDVRNNPIATLINRNFSTALYFLELSGTPIKTISRVAISDTLNFLCEPHSSQSYCTSSDEIYVGSGCHDCTSLTNVTITPTTFKALDKLNVYTRVVGTSPTGFTISTSVQTNEATCLAIGGTIQQLWKGKISQTWQVCVVPETPLTSTPSSTSASPTTMTMTIAPPDSGSSNTGLIVGIAISVVVVLGAVGVLCYRRRQKGTEPTTTFVMTDYPKDAPNDVTHYFPVLPTPAVSTGTAPGLSSTRDLSSKRGSSDDSDDLINMAPLRKYKLELADLLVIGSKPIASGAYGDVWRGRYCNDDVAIKRIKHESTKHIQKFIEEIVLHSKMRCSYIVEFVGASWRRPTDLACVVEYMDLGDLRSFLSKTTPEQFTWVQKKLSITSIIHGLIYLHTFETPIIHRDLKSRNVLLDSKKGTKLTDFGESREMDENTLTNGIGTYQWMAPEIILGKEYTVAADVYSFGVLLTEFSTHLTPYSDLINPHTNLPYNQQYLLTQVTSGTIKPTIDASHTPSWVADVARQCLATNPDDRPGMMMVDAFVRQLA